MKDKILKLRSDGRSYRQIQREIGCSRGTIAYHCGEGQKDKNRNRQIENRKKIATFINRKVETFLRNGVRNFKNGCLYSEKRKTKSSFLYKSALKKIYNTKICYLSGRSINIYDRKSYQLDHIIPVALGGKNTLKNMAVADKYANMAKSDMQVDDFIKLCIDVCVHNGYEVKIQHGGNAKVALAPDLQSGL